MSTANPEDKKAHLERDLSVIPGLRPAAREIIIDLFGWNNTHRRDTPKSLWALSIHDGFAGLLLKEAITTIMGDTLFHEIAPLLTEEEGAALIIIMGLEKHRFGHYQSACESWICRAPEVKQVIVVSVIRIILFNRTGCRY